MSGSRASQRLNPWVGLTFIPDNARMEVPPAWFLQQLHDYDPDLVILPSRARPFAYVVARRARLSGGLTDRAMQDTITQPDTRMCFKYQLVPVCLMFKHGSVWNADTVLQRLKARDTWAHGGGEKMADEADAFDAAEKDKIKQQTRNDLIDRSKDAWKSYQYRTGQRVRNAGPSRPGAAMKSSSSSTATGVTIH